MRRAAVITGIGELKPFTDSEGKTTLGIMAEATRLALQDAGLDKKDIDGLVVTSDMLEPRVMWPAVVAEYLQVKPLFMELVDLGGASAAGAVLRAAMAICAGLCRRVLCVSGDIWDVEKFYRGAGSISPIARQFEVPYGPMGANSGYAMIARRHMHEFKTTPRQLARVAVDQRFNACANPEALYYGKPLTIEQVLESPYIVEPLHLFEIVRPCSGSSVVIVSKSEDLSDAPHQPVYILGGAEHSFHSSLTFSGDLTTSPVKIASAKAYQLAGVAPEDIDFVSIYDCYTIMVLITLEDAGFCRKGEGGRFIEENDLTYLGNFPCNTHGGQLSWGQPGLSGGMSHITEAVRQLRGKAGARQVKDAELCFVNGNGGIMSEECSLILSR